MTPPEMSLHEIYDAVTRDARAEGFQTVTIENVVATHEKLQEGNEPQDIVGRQIADFLRRRLTLPALPQWPEGDGTAPAAKKRRLILELPADPRKESLAQRGKLEKAAAALYDAGLITQAQAMDMAGLSPAAFQKLLKLP